MLSKWQYLRWRWGDEIHLIPKRLINGCSSWQELHHLKMWRKKRLQKRTGSLTSPVATKFYIEKEILEENMLVVWSFNGLVYFQPVQWGFTLDSSLFSPLSVGPLLGWLCGNIYSSSSRSQSNKISLPSLQLGDRLIGYTKEWFKKCGRNRSDSLWNWNQYKKLYN